MDVLVTIMSISLGVATLFCLDLRTRRASSNPDATRVGSAMTASVLLTSVVVMALVRFSYETAPALGFTAVVVVAGVLTALTVDALRRSA